MVSLSVAWPSSNFPGLCWLQQHVGDRHSHSLLLSPKRAVSLMSNYHDATGGLPLGILMLTFRSASRRCTSSLRSLSAIARGCLRLSSCYILLCMAKMLLHSYRVPVTISLAHFLVDTSLQHDRDTEQATVNVLPKVAYASAQIASISRWKIWARMHLSKNRKRLLRLSVNAKAVLLCCDGVSRPNLAHVLAHSNAGTSSHRTAVFERCKRSDEAWMCVILIETLHIPGGVPATIHISAWLTNLLQRGRSWTSLP